MKKYILLLTLIIAGSINNITNAQAIGSWKAYPALHIATYNIPAGDKIYSLCNGNLFSYDTNTTEIYTYDRINGLHDSNIEFIRYSKTTQKLVLIYENGNVDIIYPDNTIVNLKQLKDKNYSNLKINNVYVKEEEIYICTNFGIIVLNTDKEIFENTYDLGMDVMCCASKDNYIYLSSNTGFYQGDKSLNLLDRNNWKYLNNTTFRELAFLKDELIGSFTNSGIYSINQQTFGITLLRKISFSYFYADDEYIIIGNNSNIYKLNSTQDIQDISYSNKFNHLTYHKGTYWASQNLYGLQPYQLKENELTAIQSAIQPNSPVRDYFCKMHYHNDRLLIAGGDLNYYGIIREGTVMYYENDTWYNFNEENIEEQTNIIYNNTSSIAQDPNDETHHFVSSAGHGLYEFKDLKFVKRYDYTNSPLETILPDDKYPENYVRCDALKYDSEGNLWMVNTEVEKVITVLKKDYTWTKLYYEEMDQVPDCPCLLFDSKGRIWINKKRGGEGIFVLDYNGTIDDTSDDIHVARKGLINQDGVDYNDAWSFNYIALDHDERMWVGTNSGLFVIEDLEDYINNDEFRYTQIKIARNDGTEYADYLLNGINISVITVDAANRKWIGTSNYGIYLISADGQEILQHFTTENSSLISNEIQSIAINPKTGEVMIGTTLGLMSYMSDANTPSSELDKDNVRVYPNPVNPDYNGLITVDGLTLNAEVKITTVTGQLVYSGHANGGLFTWDGKNQKGQRVSSGVYNIISTNTEGKKAIVNRITFIH